MLIGALSITIIVLVTALLLRRKSKHRKTTDRQTILADDNVLEVTDGSEKLRYIHCGKIKKVKEWPLRGDNVPFYYQKEPGNYTLKLTCPHCRKEWYVVWDDNPGPTKPLFP